MGFRHFYVKFVIKSWSGRVEAGEEQQQQLNYLEPIELRVNNWRFCSKIRINYPVDRDGCCGCDGSRRRRWASSCVYSVYQTALMLAKYHFMNGKTCQRPLELDFKHSTNGENMPLNFWKPNKNKVKRLYSVQCTDCEVCWKTFQRTLDFT